MAETPNARRERIAEALYVMMVGRTTHDRQPLLAGLCAEQARQLAEAFVAGAPEQPPSGCYPTLLEAAKELLACVDSSKGTNLAAAMLRDAIGREEARRG